MLRNGQGYKKESFKRAMAQAHKMQEYCELKVGNFPLHQVVFSIDTSSLNMLEFCRLNVGDKPYSNTLENHLTEKPANMVLILVITV
jgi:hypothetical protein